VRHHYSLYLTTYIHTLLYTRSIVHKALPEKIQGQAKPERKAVKNTKVLSFGDEDEGGDGEPISTAYMHRTYTSNKFEK
jgi:hypothetical protein